MVCVARRAGAGAGVTKATKGAGDPPPASGLSAEATARHSIDNDFEPLAVALEPWFGKSFGELPAELRQLVDKRFLIHWDIYTPAQRRSMARRWDIEHHPGLALERRDLWEKSLEISECERTGANILPENKTMTEVELKETRLRRLRKEETSLEEALQREAHSLGLGWPDDWAAPKRGGGRRTKYDWPPVLAKLQEWLVDNGAPMDGDGNQAELERFAASLFHPDDCPSESSIRPKVREAIENFRSRLNTGGR